MRHAQKVKVGEEAQIFRNTIPERLSERLYYEKSVGSEETIDWIETLPPTQGEASADEVVKFTINLVNSKYGGDW